MTLDRHAQDLFEIVKHCGDDLVSCATRMSEKNSESVYPAINLARAGSTRRISSPSCRVLHKALGARVIAVDTVWIVKKRR
jgi:hypothetical protein